MKKAKLLVMGMGLLLIGAAQGCGSSEDPGTPVKESPLQGEVKGQPFTATKALASPSASGRVSVSIFEKKDPTCADLFKPTKDIGRQILVSVESWADGSSFQLGGTQDTPLGIPLPLHSVTFVTEGSGGTPSNTIVSKGRVEVVKASSKTAEGALRLRADGGADGSIEGEVAVIHCGG